MSRWWTIAATSMLVACGGKDDTSGEEDSGTNVDPYADAPVVEEADVYCYKHTTGGVFYQWVATATVSDPQGADTLGSGIDAGHEVNVLSLTGDELAEYGDNFTCDLKGECNASWNQSWDNIVCTGADTYTIEFIVADRDGNKSKPFEVTGRVASGPEG